jgi:putative spermidine/putrescine transport system permease protein
LILLIPLVVVIPESFTERPRLAWPPRGFSTQWYSEVLHNPVWTDAIAKSAVVASGTAVLSTAIGLVLARFVLGLRSKSARSLLQSAMYAPLVVPVILLAIGIYDVEARLRLLGTSRGLIFAHAMIAFPLAFAVLSNALANVDEAVESAAWTLGASRRRAFWTIVVPNIVPSLVGALLITFVTSWDEAVIALFQTGLNKTLPVTIFSFLESGVTPAVAAVATMLVGLVGLCVLASVAFGGGKARRRAARNEP